METVQSIELAVKIGLIVVCMILTVAVVYYGRKCDKLEKQSEIDKGNIERDQARLRYLRSEIERLNKQIESNQNVIDKATARYLQQGIEIEILQMKREKRKELKIAFKKAVEEIKYLKLESNSLYEEKNKLFNLFNKENAKRNDSMSKLQDEISELRKSKDFYKAKANHQKLPVKQNNSKYWECISTEVPFFEYGKTYEDSGRKTQPELVWLKNGDRTCLNKKRNFKPVKS